MMSYSMPLPLDDGFIRRECPHCERQFKWHEGPTPERPSDVVDPAVYWCPYCGKTAPPSEWWTAEQLAFATESMSAVAMREIADELSKSIRPGSPLKISVSGDEPEPPPALQEPADMIPVQPPCHPWEPIKIAEDWSEPIHCLICGEVFALE